MYLGLNGSSLHTEFQNSFNISHKDDVTYPYDNNNNCSILCLILQFQYRVIVVITIFCF